MCNTHIHSSHVLYTDYDYNCPESIKDMHGDVVLDMCKHCGAGEIELKNSCLNNIINNKHENNRL